MKKVFNIARNIFAVIGLLLSAALIVVLCSDEYSTLRVRTNQESASHIETLKLSGPYGKDRIQFNIHPVIDTERAAEIREYFQLDTLYDETASTWEKTLVIARFVATNIPHANQTIQPEKRNAIYLWEYTKNTEPAFNCRLHSIMMYESCMSKVEMGDEGVPCLTNIFVRCFEIQLFPCLLHNKIRGQKDNIFFHLQWIFFILNQSGYIRIRFLHHTRFLYNCSEFPV